MATKKKNDAKLLSDEPILESARTDLLQFEHIAKVLGRAALHTESPITIGIFGNWGSGKTSLMRLMRQVVVKEGDGEQAAVAVWFNAWQYEREEHLIVPLIATIARDIKKRQEQWEKISLSDEIDAAARKVASRANKIMQAGGKKVHDALRSVLYGVSMKGKLGVPLLGELEISASMKDMIERYEAVTQDTLMARSLYFDAFDQLRELSHDNTIEKPQIVVFIDDLDRCFPEQAVRLLESIKLVLHQPRFAFVLGIYPQIIEEFIRNKYAAQYPMAAIRAASRGEDEFHRRMDQYLDYFNDYLGKIIQVRHDVPERRPEQMQDYIRYLLKDAGVIDEFLVEGISERDLLELIAEVGKRSPREIVRKINGLIVKWRSAKSEKGEDETYDLLAGLINETVADRVAKGKHEYDQFGYILEWASDDEGKETYGQSLAKGLQDTRNAKSHAEKIDMLKKKLVAENSPTMGSLIDILDKDEHLCNVLNSAPGRRWLAEKAFREEMRETYKEKAYRDEEAEPETVAHKAPALARERGASLAEDVTQLLPGLRMVEVEGGEFEMGSEDGRDNEKPVHTVKLPGFKISATPVTQAQYQAVMGTNPSDFKGKEYRDADNRPVENVSWKDAMVFCERLTKLTKGKYRITLPTEAQWEYAARGGNKSKGFQYCGSDNLDEVGWYDENSGGQTHPVGAKKPNELGIYDMSGNVWEWCLDKWHDSYEGAPTDGSAWETGDSSFRVLRGGSWNYDAQLCRPAFRNVAIPVNRDHYLGFRLVFVP